MRTGLLAFKAGMTRVFTEDSKVIPVTILYVDDCRVTGTIDNDDYVAVRLGLGSKDKKHTNKPQAMSFDKAGISSYPAVEREFVVSKDFMLDMHKELKPSHFKVGQYVDVSGVSIGKGFAGAMKRHNFKGLRASHGVSISHRSHGSTGQNQDPGRVFKGKKMAGHMGSANVSIQSLEIIDVIDDKKIILVKGSVPGHDGSIVRIKDAVKVKGAI